MLSPSTEIVGDLTACSIQSSVGPDDCVRFSGPSERSPRTPRGRASHSAQATRCAPKAPRPLVHLAISPASASPLLAGRMSNAEIPLDTAADTRTRIDPNAPGPARSIRRGFSGCFRACRTPARQPLVARAFRSHGHRAQPRPRLPSVRAAVVSKRIRVGKLRAAPVRFLLMHCFWCKRLLLEPGPIQRFQEVVR